MINADDIRDMQEDLESYSNFVEDLMLTKGEARLYENTFGLVGEAGEVAEKVKKLVRDGTRYSDNEILLELGDVLFYITALANLHNGDLRKVLDLNMLKLNDRKQRGKLQGSGDNR
jgi:NTP pyrophosphatase (non-canonical NTP hydrolase)